MRWGANALARWAGLRTLSIVALAGLLVSGLALGARPSSAEPEAIGVPLPATYFTGSMAPEPEPGPCPPGGRGPNTGLCIQNGGVTVTVDRKFIFVDETITATASSSVGGVIRWTTSSYSVSGCQDGDSTCTIKPFATGPAWRLIGATVLNPANLLQALAFGEAAYNVDAHLVEGTVLVENLLPPPYFTSPFPWPTTAIRFERTNADGTPTDYLYNGLYNVFGEQLNVPPGTPTDGYCYFCWASVDLNGLSGINAIDGSFRMFVPTGYYTLTIIRYPFPGQAAGRAPLPGWGTPITFYVDKDTEIHVRRDLKSIEGRVTSPSGQPLSGATITARRTGTFTGASATTGSDGRYSILVERGTYDILTPSQRGRFNPATRAVDVSQDNATGVDFVQETSRINGWLFSEEGLVRNWPVEAVGPSTQQARTDDSGFYELELEPAFWTVRPVGGVWDPPNHQIQLGSTSESASFDCLDTEICGNPTLTITFESGPTQLDIGEQGTFVFTIANVGDVPVTGVVLTGPTPVFGDGGIVLDSGPTPEAPVELAPGQSEPVSYVVVGDLEGTGRFRWSITGTADGETVGRSVVRELVIGDQRLEVEVSFDPASVDLELAPAVDSDGDGRIDGDNNGDGLVDDPSYVPKDVQVVVKVTNAGTRPVTSIDFLGADDGLDIAHEPPIVGTFPVEVISSPQPIPVLNAGEPATRSFTVRISKGGVLTFGTTALGVNSGGGNVSQHGQASLTVTTDVKLVVQLEVSTLLGRPPRVDEGMPYSIFGTVQNLTTDSVIEVGQPVARLVGNGILQPAVRLTSSFPDPATCSLGSFNATLTPEVGSNRDNFKVQVFTTATGLPLYLPDFDGRVLSNVAFDIFATIEDDQGRRALRPDEIRIEYGNGHAQLNGADVLRTSIREALPTPVLMELDDFVVTVGAYFSKNIAEGAWQWGASTLALLGSIGAAAPGFFAQIMSDASGVTFARRTLAVARYLDETYENLAPEDKDELFGVIVNDLMTQAEDRGSYTVDQMSQLVDGAFTAFFNGLSNWYDSIDVATEAGDMEALAQALGKPGLVVGNLLADFLSGAAIEKGICHLLQGGRYLRGLQASADQVRAGSAARVEAATTAARGQGDPRTWQSTPAEVRAVHPTDNLPPASTAAVHGVDRVTDAQAREMTRTMPSLFMVFKSRSDKVLEWLQRSLPALVKPQPVKEKTIGFWDIRTGGFRAADEASVVVAEPLPLELVNNQTNGLGLTADEALAARRQNAMRGDEWDRSGQVDLTVAQTERVSLRVNTRPITDTPGVEGVEGFMDLPRRSDGSLDFSQNAEFIDPVTGATRPTTWEPVRYQLRRVPPDQVPLNSEFRQLTGRDREYYELWIQDPQTKAFRRVTGDQDPLFVGSLDGRPLPPDKAVQVFGQMTHTTQTQHPAAYTLTNAELRTKLLSDPEILWNPNPSLRGKGAVGYVNGEAHSVWLKEISDPQAPAVWLNWEGKPITLDDLDVGPIGDVPVPTLPPLPRPNVFRDPVKSVQSAGGIDRGASLPPACQIAVAGTATGSGPSPAVLRAGDDRVLQQWSPGGGWVTSPLADQCATGAIATIVLAPQTGLSADAPAGSQTLAVFDQSNFSVGQTVVIDPGRPNEETALVVGFGSLVLDRATAFAHDAGAMVSVVPAAATDSAAPVVVCGPAPAQWHNANVSIACTASDSGSGLANPTDAAFTLDTNVAAGQAAPNASSNSRAVCDVAGNCANAGPISGIRVDRATPTTTVAVPLAGSTYTLGALVAPSYVCADVGSGVASCAGPAVVDTSTGGSRTFTVTATDLAGNVATTTVTYQITAVTAPTLALRVEAGAITPAAGRKDSSVVLAGRWTVPAPSPMTCGENVTITIGSFTETLPGSRFRSVLGICTYVRPKAIASYAAIVALDLRRGLFTIVASGPTPTFASFVNPVVIGLRIGDDAGTTSVTFKRRGAVWLYPN